VDFFATCARGTEDVLAKELRTIGATDVNTTRGGAAFAGPLETGYAACLWSRVASRVLLPLATVDATTADALYDGAADMDWQEHLGPEQTFAVHAVGKNPELRHSRFVALKVKDALCDRIRTARGARPNVDTENPDVRIHVHVSGNDARISVDLSGPGLHKRGFARHQTDAPLKETLAAALLMMCNWPARARAGEPLMDPMCGSGTLLVEAAWMATDTAPGLLRQGFGFTGWRGHDERLWQRLRSEARDRIQREGPLRIYGRDASSKAIAVTRENLRRAGVDDRIRVERGVLRDATPPEGEPPGLLITNPPYGERLGQAGALAPLYETLGDVLRRRFGGWTAAVFSGNKALSGRIGLKPGNRFHVSNGPIECQLLEYPIREAAVASEGPAWRKPSPESEMFANRLEKNRKKIGKWARRGGISSYRVYDADIPEYNVAVDLYGDSAHIQEYSAPWSVDPAAADKRLRDIRLVVPDVLGLKPENVFLKVRERSEGGSQYGRLAELEAIRIVTENKLRYEVNLSDFLDTGLFLDHRKVRARLRAEAKGKNFLNLFSYTCSASVAAAAGGAAGTWSVDLSKNYLSWGRRNFALNDLAREINQTWHGDWQLFLRNHQGPRFDLVYLGPPTYSKSKDAPTFDLQRDHSGMLHSVMDKMTRDGVIYFGAPSRRFMLDRHRIRGAHIEDVSEQMIPKDFARSRDAFHMWRITRDRG
jgi:23S rRNA (guanine2445-N2)-methyltransferase / 23S rRNA (guanine2069-N7)-methyltransferase